MPVAEHAMPRRLATAEPVAGCVVYRDRKVRAVLGDCGGGGGLRNRRAAVRPKPPLRSQY